MLQYLGNERMCSEEEVEKDEGGKKSYVFITKVCVWRAAEVDDHLLMVDDTEKALFPTSRKGPKRAARERDGTASASGAPKGLPKCLYDAAWIECESETNPVFYKDLQVSEDVFYLLAAAGRKF